MVDEMTNLKSNKNTNDDTEVSSKKNKTKQYELTSLKRIELLISEHYKTTFFS